MPESVTAISRTLDKVSSAVFIPFRSFYLYLSQQQILSAQFMSSVSVITFKGQLICSFQKTKPHIIGKYLLAVCINLPKILANVSFLSFQG